MVSWPLAPAIRPASSCSQRRRWVLSLLLSLLGFCAVRMAVDLVSSPCSGGSRGTRVSGDVAILRAEGAYLKYPLCPGVGSLLWFPLGSAPSLNQ
jgi:hypothetical protein